MGILVTWRDPTQPLNMGGLSFDDFTSISDVTATSFRWNQADGGYVVMAGTGFAYDANGIPTLGTITSFDFTDGSGQPQMLITGASIPAALMWQWVITKDVNSFGKALLPGNDAISGNAQDDILIGGPGADAQDGGAGNDLASYQNASASVTASLANPAANAGQAAGDTYAFIEGLVGSDFADTLVGDSGDNALIGRGGDDTLIGGAGADLLDGGTGNDYASYVDAPTEITASLANPAINTGDAAEDAYVSIERLAGSAFGDILIGDDGSNTLRGNGGADQLDGGEGFDYVSYFASADGVTVSLANPDLNTGEAAGDTFTSIEGLTGSLFDDVLIGDAGDNYLLGQAGADDLDGSAGFDVASYGVATAAVTASLANPSINTGEAAGDTYTSIEGLAGSSSGDTLIGDAANNALYGNGGDDTLVGGTGADLLDGGAGSDYASYLGSPIGLTVSLANPAINTGEAAGDVFISIERLAGSAFDDILIGNSSDNTLRGNDGADGLDGGAGFDYASYFASPMGVTASLANPADNTGEAAGDTYTSIEALAGSTHDDVLIGDSGGNWLVGQDGADRLDGGAGFDTAGYQNAITGITASLADSSINTGQAAGDSYQSIEALGGSSFDDVLIGDAGNNSLRGQGGADHLDGGAGFDTASYNNATSGVIASLAYPALNTGEAAGDTYTSIEALSGSNFNDTLGGDAGSNTLNGNLGADIFVADGGDDTYAGNNGGLDGATDIVDYSRVYGLSQGITVNWTSGTVNGEASKIGTDRLFQIEGIFGTAFGDVFNATGYSSALGIAGDFSAYQLIRPGGGDDTVIGNFNTEVLYGDATDGITVTLTAIGTGTVSGAGVGTDRLTGVNRFTGSNFDDTFFGSGGNDIFDGYNGGNDVFHGGAAFDTVEYDGGARQAISVNLATGLVTGRSPGSNIGTDTLDSIERVRGSEQDDLYDATGFSGSSTNAGSSGTFNIFEGQGGADTIIGNDNTSLVYFNAGASVTVSMTGQGMGTATATYGGTTATDTFSGVGQVQGSSFNDSFVGSSGNDVFAGGGGNDLLQGGEGDDTLEGGPAADTLDGGAGFDSASYANAAAAVTASLANSAINTGDAAGDTYISIEGLIGSNFADVLIGDAGNNTLSGGNGDDVLEGGAGADNLDGGAGFDTAAYDHAAGGVTASLANPDENIGEAAGDTYTSVERLSGSVNGDVLIGDAGGNWLIGNGGGDILDGRDGSDGASYFKSSVGVTASLANPGINTGEAAGDQYFSIENLQGSSHDDALVGDRGSNWLDGGVGADALDGQDGIDIAWYVNATSGVTVSLVTPSLTNTGEATGDTFTSIEGISGSNFIDFLIGDNNDNFLYGSGGDDSLIGDEGSDYLDGGLGTDIASYVGASDGLTVSLANTLLNTGEAAGDTFVSVEGLFGSAFDDTLIGDAGNNVLRGYLGADTLHGGDGIDTASYIGSSGVIASLANPGMNSGEAAGDSYSSIENLSGTSFDDSLYGDGGNNTLSGGFGLDRLYGGLGDDTLFGDIGDDWFIGGAGNDTFFGDTGTDVVMYNVGPDAAMTGISLNLLLGTATDGLGGVDTLFGVEAAHGSDFADTIIMSNASGHVFGRGGDDTIIGGTSSDNINGGSGDDTIDGGAGTDTANYRDDGFDGAGPSTHGVTVDLAAGTALDNWGNNDVLTSIENVTGSDFADTLVGDDKANILTGNGGHDMLLGGGGNDTLTGGVGNDVIDGGVGYDFHWWAKALDFDTADYRNAPTSGILVDLAAGTVSDGQGGTDAIHNVEQVFGSAFDDTFHGGGSARFEAFRGGAGDDTIWGAGDRNTRADYTDSTGGVTITLTGDADGLGMVSGGSTGYDTLHYVNQLYGSAFDDVYDASAYTLSMPDASFGFNVFRGGAGNDTIIGNGNTRLDFSNSASGITIDLGQDTVSDGLGGTDTFSGVNAVVGTSFDDVMHGTAASEVFIGRGGNDVIHGGAGLDEARYDGGTDPITVGITVDMAAGTVVGDATFVGSDRLYDIEAIRGSLLDDFYDARGFVGGGNTGTFRDGPLVNPEYNRFAGLSGDDTIIGNGQTALDYRGSSTAITVTFSGQGMGTAIGDMDGTDTFWGVYSINDSRHDDLLTGSDASAPDYWEVFNLSAGDDTVHGGGGNDAVSYSSTISDAVHVVFTGVGMGTATGNGTDTFDGIEWVLGSLHDDTLVGGAGNETFSGLAGDDVLDGGAGIDTLDYFHDTGPVTVHLTDGTASDGFDNTDTISNFEIVLGSVHADVIVGSNFADTLYGNAGDDSLVGNAGDDNLHGGDGNDAVTGGNAADELYGEADDDSLIGGNGNDTLDGGSGDDVVGGSAGDDLAIWHGAENVGATDIYQGGAGFDTLQLDLADAQYNTDDVQAEIAVYLAFLNSAENADGDPFTFTTLGLTVYEFEDLIVHVGDNQAPVAVDDTNADDRVVEAGVDGAGDPSAAGDVLANDTDADAGDTKTVQGVGAGALDGPLSTGVGATIVGTYGSIVVAADGSYTYSLDNADSDTQGLAGDESASDIFTYTMHDGAGAASTARITIGITGVNDAAVISGTTTGSLTEKGGVENGTPGVATATGVLSASDPDSSPTFVVQSDESETYGTFSITSDGTWTYRLDDEFTAVEKLQAGETVHEVVTVSTSDGTTQEIDIAIHGANDSAEIFGDRTGRVVEKGGVANGTPGTATTTGMLSVVDVDSPETFVVQNKVAKSFGTFSIDASGHWSYTLNDGNAAVQALNEADTLHELVTVSSADGTTHQIDIAIDGANDAAVIGGTATGSVTEKGGPANGTAGVATATGDLDATDVDSPATFLAQTDQGKSFGTFSIDAAGAWSYTLDDGNISVQALNAGSTLHELVTVSTADGTTHQIDITIHGANDAAVISGDATGSVTEKSGVANGTVGNATATGTLSVTDVDNAATFVTQTDAAMSFGTFSINSVGAWTYNLNDNNSSVQALNAGDTLHELVTVSTADGTTQQIDITIHGANDAAVVSGDTTGSVTEKGGVNNGTPGVATATGDLDASDVDSPTTFVAQTNAAKSFGTFSINSAGAWTYILNDNDSSVQALNAGGTLHELVTVSTADGTTQQIDIIIHGANDAAVVSGDTTGSVTEKGGVNNGTPGVATATGTLSATDVDSASTFAVQDDVAKSFGTFSIDAAGAWTYTLDDGNASVQALNAGDTLHELVTVATADGTTQQIDITIHGADDATVIGDTTGSVTEKGGVANGTAGMATATGALSAGEASFVTQTNAAKSFGTFSIDAAGAWTYTLNDNNSSVQGLNAGDTLHELVTVATTDGTTQQIDITIHGANDAAVISGDVSGSVTEKGGVANGTPGVATATGSLSASDVDSAATFVAQDGVAKSFGTFSIDAAGAWTYTLDDGNAAVQALNAGDTLHELVTVSTADGTTRQIDITIHGADDATLISGETTGSVTEKGGVANGTPGVATATGSLSASDVDNAATFVAQSNAAKSFGTFSIDAAGAWTYTLDDGNASVQALNAGGTLHELVTVSTAEGTTQQIDITIHGANDAAVISGETNGSVTEKGGLSNQIPGVATATGTLNASDADGLATFIVQNEVAKSFGTFSITSAGAWTYTLDDSNPAVESLYAGDTLHELVTVSTADGTTREIDITIHGADDSGIDLSLFTPDKGFVIQGAEAGARTGRSVASAGDVNGDGFGDVIVGAPFSQGDAALNVGSHAGEAYVVFGGGSGFGTVDDAGRALIDLASLAASDGFVIRGPAAGDLVGWSVASAGDVNGDGFGDLVVGDPSAGDGGNATGAAYVLFGKESGFGTMDGAGRAVVDLAGLAAEDGFVIRGNAAGDSAGWNVASAGDMNGDGLDDLLVGAPFGGAGGNFSGQAYVVFGKAPSDGSADASKAVIELADLDADEGFMIRGAASGDQAGWSVASLGDVNGDSFDDLIIGAPFGTDGGLYAGQAYVVFGTASGLGAVDSSGHAVLDLGNAGATFTPDKGFVIQGDEDWTFAGWSVASAGDVNGDGFGDMIVGGPFGGDVANPAGQAYVIYGGASGFGTLDALGRAVVDLANGGSSFTADKGFIVTGEAARDRTGLQVAGGGDLNGDGFADLLVGAPFASSGGDSAGNSYVLFGGSHVPGTIDSRGRAIVDVAALSPINRFLVQGDRAHDQSGFSIAAVADVNGDGVDDVTVGAPDGDDGGDDAGEAYVLFGTPTDLGSTRLFNAAGTFYMHGAGRSAGPRLTYDGAAVTVGQFAGWAPFAAEQVADGGYQVAWKIAGTDQYGVWKTDSSGNMVSATGVMSGSDFALQAFEAGFRQDLNDDGAIGPATTVIESSGSTTLEQVADTYRLSSGDGSPGPQLAYGGAPVTAGQFAGWEPIAAEQLAGGGYQVAWKVAGTDQYGVWNTDSTGNMVSATGVLLGSSTALQTFEQAFEQDLNGDGTIGLARTVIESAGSTVLEQVADTYRLSSDGSPGPQLAYGGAPVTAGQFGAWQPLAAEQLADGGYQVAWKAGGTDQYAVWDTDSGGSMVSATGAMSGSSYGLQALEQSFQQDLNGDGTIGLVTTVIESSGSTVLKQIADTYRLSSDGSPGAQLAFGDAPVTVGQFGAWTPIAAEQLAEGGYQVAWKVAGTDQYGVWNTDGSGDMVSATAVMTGSSQALQAFEQAFQQDLNSDGTIGPDYHSSGYLLF